MDNLQLLTNSQAHQLQFNLTENNMEAMKTKEDLPAEAKLWNTILGFAETHVLRCAVQLDLADIIHNHGTPITLSQLSLHLPNQPVDQSALFRIMRYLVHMEFFTQSSADGEIRYGLAPPAMFLIKESDKCRVNEILTMTNKDFMAPWYYLKDTLSSESGTAFEKALGTNMWGYMVANPEKARYFHEAMANDTRVTISSIVGECSDSFDGITTLVDVGGCTGTASMIIAKAIPHIKCTVYDLPHVIAHAPSNSEVDFVEGDMFESIPKADAILIKSVLHDWDDEKCIEILKKCKEAVPRDGGKVIIVEIVLNVDSDHPFTKTVLALDLWMMQMSGKERSEEEWKKLIHDAGYTGYKITQTSAPHSIIEAYPY